MQVIPILAAFVVGVVHFLGEKIDKKLKHKSHLIVSLSTGVTLAYFFTAMIPESIEHELFGIQGLSILVGISIFYVLEEVIYDKSKNLGVVRHKFKELHTVFVGLYHVAIGIVLVFLYETSQEQFILFFIPVLIHTAFNSMSMKEMHEEMLEKPVIKLVIGLSTVLGVLLGILLDFSQTVMYSLLGTIGGAFIYIVIHDSLDPRTERPVGFIAGVILFLVIAFALTLLL